MAKYVHEIMNHELFTVGPYERTGDVRGYLTALAITGAPVVDDSQRPVGFVSLRDLVSHADEQRVHECMSSPADTIARGASIREAAEHMADRGRHHLAVIDDVGHVVGFVGTLDVMRGMLGRPVPHPGDFPHHDATAGVTWSDDWPLAEANVTHAPDGPGLLRLIESRPGEPDRVVASEARWNVRTRLLDLLSLPQPQLPHLTEALERGRLRFRAAATTALPGRHR